MRKTYIYKSPIQGRGLFAQQTLQKGKIIGYFRGTRLSPSSSLVEHSHVLWTKNFLILGTNNLRFVNHSNNPNAYFQGVRLITLRKIAAHEEITVDYSGE